MGNIMKKPIVIINGIVIVLGLTALIYGMTGINKWWYDISEVLTSGIYFFGGLLALFVEISLLNKSFNNTEKHKDS